MRLPVRQIASVGSQTVPPIVPVKNRHAQQSRTQHQTQRNEKHTIRPLPGWRNTVTIHHTNNLTFDAVSNFAEAAGRIVVSREGTNGLESHSRGVLSGRSVSAMRAAARSLPEAGNEPYKSVASAIGARARKRAFQFPQAMHSAGNCGQKAWRQRS